ncbi:hypothetical protein PRNP1_007943 [Phytophthora ramorum]
MTRVDPLFEFDASQAFRDLSAALPPYREGEHDPWFDCPHPEHSKPSAELAKSMRKLQEQLQDRAKPKSNKKWSMDKENRQPDGTNRRESVLQHNKQLKTKRKSLKEMRAVQEPFQVATVNTEERKTKRKPLAERKDAGNRKQAGRKREKTEVNNVEALLARHNKKFKAMHTYEPPRHSVREVKQWEREMKRSYYALSAEERVQANQEIAVWKKRRVGTTH